MVNKRLFNACAYFTIGLLGLYISSYQNLINLIVLDLKLSSVGMGVIVALHFIGSATVPPLFGKISDKKGGKMLLLTALALSIAGLTIMWLSKTSISMGIGVLLVGCGYAAEEGLLTALLPFVNPGDSNRILNRSQMFFCIGAILGPVLSTISLHRTESWRVHFLLLSFLYVIAFVFMLFLPIKTAKLPVQSKVKKRLLLSSKMIILCIILSVYVGIEQGLGFFMVKFFSLCPVELLSGIALTGYWFGMFVGRLAGGFFKRNHTRWTVVGLCLTVPLFVVIVLIGANFITAVLFGICGLLLSLTWSTVVAITVENFKDQSGEAVGYLMTAGAFGGALFPFLMGTITAFYGVGIIFFIMPILSSISVILLFSSLKSKQ